MKHIFSKLTYLTFGVFMAGPVFGQSADNTASGSRKLDDLKINQVQVLGTHNSYAMPVDKSLMRVADPIFDQMMKSYFDKMPLEQLAAFKEFHPNSMKMSEGLNYNHPPFDVQLDAGIRNLEIDVYYDPTGNRFNDPAGYRMLREKGFSKTAPFSTKDLDKPGLKVLHIADFDFRTHYTTFRDALAALKEWSDQHPDHFPISIQVEAKDSSIPVFPHAAEVLPFDKAAFDELDSTVLAILGRDKLIVPDDVRGNFSTLNEAVLANNWPTVKASRGKFLFLLLPATAGLSENNAYLEGHLGLKKRVMFIQSKPGEAHATFLLMDNALTRKKDIQQLVKQGYMIRTRADIETYEAKVNDQGRARAAFESGAQIISTDFFRPGNGYGTPYFVKLPLPGEANRNPVNAR